MADAELDGGISRPLTRTEFRHPRHGPGTRPNDPGRVATLPIGSARLGGRAAFREIDVLAAAPTARTADPLLGPCQLGPN